MNDESGKQSKLMQALYGEAADEVFDRLESLDSTLNEMIQAFAYDRVWQIPTLSMREKSLITVASLVALGKPEQLRWHMKGFLNCGGSEEELRAMVIHLALYCGFPASLAAFAVLNDISADKSKPT